MIAREVKFLDLQYVGLFMYARSLDMGASLWYSMQFAIAAQNPVIGNRWIIISLIFIALFGYSLSLIPHLWNKTYYLSNGRIKYALVEVKVHEKGTVYRTINVYRKYGSFWFRIPKPVKINDRFLEPSIYSYTPNEWWDMIHK